MKQRLAAVVSLLIVAAAVCVLTVRLRADPAGSAEAKQVLRLPGVWKLSKVTRNDGEGEIVVFENGKGHRPSGGVGRDSMGHVELGYSWFAPMEIMPGRQFQVSLSVCLKEKLDDKARDNLTANESYLTIFKGDHQQIPQVIMPAQPKIGIAGYRIPHEFLASDTWLGGVKYGQTVVAMAVGVIYERNVGVIWYTYYYTFSEAPARNEGEEGEDKPNDQNDPSVQLTLTHPAGRSPKVFTSGWVFGAQCTAEDKDGEVVDLSDKVQWSGSGAFAPATGSLSRPTFGGAGANTIVLKVEMNGKTFSRTCRVQTVSPTKYACVGGMSACEACAHGCPACPHPTSGPICTGSSLVHVGGKPAARVGDVGVTILPCCGTNFFEITAGDDQVLINGRPAALLLSETKHCGGTGRIIGTGQ
jgi:uncharacterized Zn-binding protein involved in type VI secretion